MPSDIFSLKSLRRRSRASFRAEGSVSVEAVPEVPPVAKNSSADNLASPKEGTATPSSNGTSRPKSLLRPPPRMRSSDLYNTDASSDASRNTAPTNGSVTPPSNHGSDLALDQQLKQDPNTAARPAPHPLSSSNRPMSVSGMSGLGSSAEINGTSKLPRSEYEPRVLNAPGNRPIYQKALALVGTVGDPAQHTVDDGWITITRKNERFPPTHWPVHASHWKAVVYLEPGPNELQFTTWTPKLANASSSNPIHTSFTTIHMVPPHNAPPLQLAILLAKDSPGIFDTVPQKKQHDLAAAVRKYRTAAYLWQAFITEQMRREKMGCRSFSFEEEWGRSSSHLLDRENGIMRSEARVHIIRSDKTVADIHAMTKRGQAEGSSEKGELFDFTTQAVNNYFQPIPGERRYVSVLLMDAHWDKDSQTILGHSAQGGQAGDLSLAMFGSHCLHSFPDGLDEIPSAFEDCTRTDLDYVANDSSSGGTSWEVASFGMGAHLHEVARLFSCVQQGSGIMSGEFQAFSRSFVSCEPYSTRTKSKQGLVWKRDECSLHRLDCLRLRFHPCFRLPTDEFHPFDDSIQAYPVEGGKVVFKARSRISHMEIWSEKDEICSTWMEFGAERGLANNICLTEQEVRGRLPENKRRGRLQVKLFSGAGGCLVIDDFKKLCSKESSLKLNGALGPLARMAYRSRRVGPPQTEGTEVQEVIFSSGGKDNRVLTSITAYHDDNAVYGLEFGYEDSSTQLLGEKKGIEGGNTVDLDLRRGEYISGFYVRERDGIAGIGVMTSGGRGTPIFGDAFGGVANNIIPPKGFSICGVAGTLDTSLKSFGVIISR